MSLYLEYLLQKGERQGDRDHEYKVMVCAGYGVGVVARIDSRKGQVANAPGRQESELHRTPLGEAPQPQRGTRSHHTGASE